MIAGVKQKNRASSPSVILSGGQSPESKDLRTDLTANVVVGAKILRLHSAALHCAQDDTLFGALELFKFQFTEQ
jgi:hypothetical protein